MIFKRTYLAEIHVASVFLDDHIQEQSKQIGIQLNFFMYKHSLTFIHRMHNYDPNPYSLPNIRTLCRDENVQTHIFTIVAIKRHCFNHLFWKVEVGSEFPVAIQGTHFQSTINLNEIKVSNQYRASKTRAKLKTRRNIITNQALHLTLIRVVLYKNENET